MRRDRMDWDRYVPAGLDGRRERGRVLGGLAAGTVWSLLLFLACYCNEINQARAGEKVDYPREFMPNAYKIASFDSLLIHNFIGFAVFALCMLPLALRYYLSHYQGGRSIYLMRRLPDRWELHRRCLTLPLLGLVLSVLIPVALVAVYFCIYQFCTPARWLNNWGAPIYSWLYGLFYA